MGRLGLAFRCFFAVLGGKPVPEDAIPEPEETLPALPEPEPEPDPALLNTPAIQMLGLLQKEGRLLDFLQEEIDAYTDEQIGAGVREIHRDCRKVIEETLAIQPVLPGHEGGNVTVPAGFDPSAIRLIGNVTGEPPFSGTLRHPGWKTSKVNLSERPDGHDPTVISPAEVEL